jgi:ribonuclease BN (tRNA processing enzyme)
VSPDGALELTILGSSSSSPRPGRACSGYLVQGAGSSVLLDLGSGALANLRRTLAADAVDAIVISHMHPDHFLDLIPLRYALRYGPRSNQRKPKLYMPPGGDAMLRKLATVLETEPHSDFLSVYDLDVYDPQAELRVGELRLRFAPTTHFIPAYAVRADCGDRSVTYSADTAPDARVAALARETDAFICEATLGPDGSEDAPRGHMSAAEAGALAQRAAARHLLLTHYGASWDGTALVRAAAAAFAGPVTLGDDNARVPLG